MTATHSNCSSVRSGGERERRQRGQDSDEHKLRGEENHVGQSKMKQSEMRPVAGVK